MVPPASILDLELSFRRVLCARKRGRSQTNRKKYPSNKGKFHGCLDTALLRLTSIRFSREVPCNVAVNPLLIPLCGDAPQFPVTEAQRRIQARGSRPRPTLPPSPHTPVQRFLAVPVPILQTGGGGPDGNWDAPLIPESNPSAPGRGSRKDPLGPGGPWIPLGPGGPWIPPSSWWTLDPPGSRWTLDPPLVPGGPWIPLGPSEPLGHTVRFPFPTASNRTLCFIPL